jgi:hypothetical protein
MTIKNLKPIPGFSGYYISKEGKVYSDKRLGKKIELKDSLTAAGYRKIGLANDDKEIKHFQVHRLVAQCFIKNPKNLPIVNHKNGKKDDNRLLNLEWTDAKGNAKHYQKVLRPKSSMVKIEKKQKAYMNTHYEKLATVMDEVMRTYAESDPALACKIYKVISQG